MESVEAFVEQYSKRSLLRFSTAGSVDDGKSTLIGRLLHDAKCILEDHLASVKKASRMSDVGEIDFSLFTDGLKAEREQGITIDVAYRFFSTPKRNFIIADTPGHEQYTRNMATGASTANLAIILVDARNGILPQTKRHSFISSLLGIPRLLIAVNKMDLVNYSEARFNEICDEYRQFATKMGITDLKFIPISALKGDNVVDASTNMPWYSGESVMSHLENVYVGSDRNMVDFRFPVQYVIRPDSQFRGFAGQIQSGVLRKGDEIMILPSQKKSRVKSIQVFEKELDHAFAPMSVTITLDREIDVSRGDMIVRAQNIPHIETHFEAMLVWLNEKPFDPETLYHIKHGTRSTRAHLDSVQYRVNINTLHREEVTNLSLNDIGRVTIKTHQPILLDAYSKNPMNGCFILMDPTTNSTVAAGMIIDRLPSDQLRQANTTENRNLTAHQSQVTKNMRERVSGHKAVTLWLTGLSASGKSTIAMELETKLFETNKGVFRLDGDNVRLGLNNDLGFSLTERRENIRRVAEVAKLMNEAGLICIVSLISPYKEEREMAKQIIHPDSFFEVFVDTPLEICELRDPKGLYKKARKGEIPQFTGVSDPYESPTNPQLRLDTTTTSVQDCVELVMKLLS